MDATGIPISEVTTVGQADDGAIVQVKVRCPDNQEPNFFIPYQLVPKLLMAIQTGARMAAEARTKKFGSIAAADVALGVSAMNIVSYALGLGWSDQKNRFDVVVQLKTEGKLSFDLGFPPTLANTLAEALRETAKQAQSQKRPKPN